MFRKVTSQTRFDSIEVLRFPLIILVVFVHVIPAEMHAVRLTWDIDNGYTLFSELISHNIGRIAVPCFFLFSGFFFFLQIQTFNANIYVKQLAKRWQTLIVPYFSWNILFMIIVLVKNFIFGNLGLMKDDIYVSLQKHSYFEILWVGPILFPLWFLRDLICMTILSPLFYLLFKSIKGFGLVLLIAVYLSGWELYIPGLSSTAILFFGAGAFMGIYKYDLMALGERYRVWKLLTAILFLGIATYFNATPHYEYWIRPFILFGVITILCIGTLLVKMNNLKSYFLGLSSSVFFIYAAHSVYIINWLKGGFAKSPLSDNGWWKLLAYFTIPIICLTICLYLYRFMRKYLPIVLSVLIGGRKSLNP